MIFIASAMLFAAVTNASDLEVEVVGVREIRSSGRVKSAEPILATSSASAEMSPGLNVFLDIPALEKRVLDWEIVVTEASDDVGTRLDPPIQREKQDSGTNVFRSKRRGDRIRVDLGISARQAEQIASLSGELRLVVGGEGEEKVATVPGIKSLLGKTLESPEIEATGAIIQVAQQGQLKQQELTVMVSSHSALGEIDISVTDADGGNISTGGHGSALETAAFVWTERLKRPLRDSDVLKISFEAGERQAITVPFDLKDIELP